jgi:hypothetical protein
MLCLASDFSLFNDVDGREHKFSSSRIQPIRAMLILLFELVFCRYLDFRKQSEQPEWYSAECDDRLAPLTVPRRKSSGIVNMNNWIQLNLSGPVPNFRNLGLAVAV